MKKILTVSIDEDVFESIERERGELIDRSTFVNEILKKNIKGAKNGKSNK